jgi:hypothetical protein
MTPQSSVMFAAPIRPGAQVPLRELLGTMNNRPGVYSPSNSLIPLHKLEKLHFCRILIVSDLAAADRRIYGLPELSLPDYLVFLAEVDGDEPIFRRELVSVAESGLWRIFSYCDGFATGTDLYTCLGHSTVPAAATYVNWLGRTVKQVRQEEALRRSLADFLHTCSDDCRGFDPQKLHADLKQFVAEQQSQGRLPLSPEEPTPLVWRLRNVLHLFYVPLVLLVCSPLLLACLPFLLWKIRQWERNDPAVAPPLELAHAEALSSIENYDVTNQFNVFGSLKPGRLRGWIVRFLLWVTDYAARHVYHRGGLARVSTIHFARWVPMDSNSRMLFSSVYDGSLESYMDDFINKVGFGLNLTFSNGIGYPRTRWLLLDGCRDEQTFKRVLRRHQLATEVWYSAHPGLSASNKHRNMQIRAGLENHSMTEEQIRTWLALI